MACNNKNEEFHWLVLSLTKVKDDLLSELGSLDIEIVFALLPCKSIEIWAWHIRVLLQILDLKITYQIPPLEAPPKMNERAI